MIPLAPTPPVPSSPGITVETPNVSESCRADALCSRVLEITDNQWLANSSYVLIVKPLRIVGDASLLDDGRNRSGESTYTGG